MAGEVTECAALPPALHLRADQRSISHDGLNADVDSDVRPVRELAAYTFTDVLVRSGGDARDFRLFPTAEVARHMIGQAKAIAAMSADQLRPA